MADKVGFVCGYCGFVEYSEEEYMEQLTRAWSLWKCPKCRSTDGYFSDGKEEQDLTEEEIQEEEMNTKTITTVRKMTDSYKLSVMPYAFKAALAIRKAAGEPKWPAILAVAYIAVTRYKVSRKTLLQMGVDPDSMGPYWDAIVETNEKWPDDDRFIALANGLAGRGKAKIRVAFIRGERVVLPNGRYYFNYTMRKLDPSQGGAEVAMG